MPEPSKVRNRVLPKTFFLKDFNRFSASRYFTDLRSQRAMPETVVITGASAGVGRAVARRFAKDGCNIGLIARDSDRLERAAAEIREQGGRAEIHAGDIADPTTAENAAAAFEDTLGPIDIWINVAMATIFAPFSEITPEEFKRATEVTYLGYVYSTMAALKRMRTRNRGVIVQTGSALAYRSIPLQSPYCGAKHAIVGFTDSIRSELIHDDSAIDITVVQLPAVNTPQFDWGLNKLPNRPQPVPPIYEPEIAANAIHYAAHHPRRELWLGWSSVMAILGQRVMPGYLDRMLAKKAWSGQQTDAPALDRPNNLFSTVKGDYGAHGRFDDRARGHSSELWLVEREKAVLVVAGVVLLAAMALLAYALA
jgi:short-subunit dehydrogenase